MFLFFVPEILEIGGQAAMPLLFLSPKFNCRCSLFPCPRVNEIWKVGLPWAYSPKDNSVLQSLVFVAIETNPVKGHIKKFICNVWISFCSILREV